MVWKFFKLMKKEESLKFGLCSDNGHYTPTLGLYLISMHYFYFYLGVLSIIKNRKGGEQSFTESKFQLIESMFAYNIYLSNDLFLKSHRDIDDS